MRYLLLTLLLLGNVANATADQIPAVANRVSDTSVSVSLPSLPAGSEYHNVWIVSGTEVTDEIVCYLVDGQPTWQIESTFDWGTIGGIVCTTETCTPFSVKWKVKAKIHTRNVLAAGSMLAALLFACLIIAYCTRFIIRMNQ